jgi:hypothetical protein
MSALATVLSKTEPDAEITNISAQLLREAIAKTQWDEARKTLEILKTMGLQAQEYALFSLLIETSAENWPAAREALVALDKIEVSDDIKRRRNDLAAKIPAETPAPVTPPQ